MKIKKEPKEDTIVEDIIVPIKEERIDEIEMPKENKEILLEEDSKQEKNILREGLTKSIIGMEEKYVTYKVAGTKDGITALQMDIKIDGINKKILKEALAQAKKARLEILEVIENQISEPRKDRRYSGMAQKR